MRGRAELKNYFAFVIVMIVVSALLVWSLESTHPDSNLDSFGDALWWAAVTCTTVGYGDHFPITTAARVIAFLLMLVGIGGLSMITASIAAYFVEQDEEPDDAHQEATLEAIQAQLVELQRRLDAGGVLGPGDG